MSPIVQGGKETLVEKNEPIVLARNRYELSFAYLLEQYRCLRRGGVIAVSLVLGVPILVYCITKIAFRAVWSIVTGAIFWEGVSMWLAVALLLAYVVGLVLFLFSPQRRAKRSLRRAVELFGTPPEIRMDFREDTVLIRTPVPESGLCVPYAVIGKCIETSSLFLLVTKEKQVFAVVKQGLLDVDEAGFRKLIVRKCPNAKCNWRSAE